MKLYDDLSGKKSWTYHEIDNLEFTRFYAAVTGAVMASGGDGSGVPISQNELRQLHELTKGGR